MARPSKLDIYQQKKIVKLYSENQPIKILGELFEVSNETIRNILIKHNIKRKSASDIIKNKTLFSFRGMNKEKAFVLGVIYGDGSISIRQDYISITSGDLEILEKTKLVLGGKFKIQKVKDSNCYRGIIYSHKLCEELLELFKLCNNKSDKLVFPQLSNDLLPAFISGYLATDGCITIANNKKTNNKMLVINFYSCSGMYLQDLNSFLNEKINIKGNFYERKNLKGHLGKKPLFILTFNGTKAEKLINYICENTNTNIQCDRKINKYNEYMLYKYNLLQF